MNYTATDDDFPPGFTTDGSPMRDPNMRHRDGIPWWEFVTEGWLGKLRLALHPHRVQTRIVLNDRDIVDRCWCGATKAYDMKWWKFL